MGLLLRGLLLLGACASLVSADDALEVDLTDASSIKAAMSSIAWQLVHYYKGNESGQTPGILPGPPPNGDYYWWEAGAMWGTLVDYWHYTTDTTYTNLTEYCLIFQSGPPDYRYMPENWTSSLGNDDQGFWGLSAMLAAESNFQNPDADEPQWLALAQAVFNSQAARWSTEYCDGGLRWQIPLTNNGYNYKNSITQGIFFNTAARLARYTGNDTYATWAETAYNWTQDIGYIDESGNIYDGGHVEENCTDINKAQYSYVPAVFIQGAGFMYNYTDGSDLWAERITLLVNRTFEYFFSDGVAVEVACELDDTIQCTADMLSYKSYLHRWLAQTTQVAPFIHDTIMPKLKTSAEGAVKSCVSNGTCGFRWTTGSFDGDTGAGQQMNALGALMSVLLDLETVETAYTNSTGGTSQGDASAGTGSSTTTVVSSPITTSDRAGASILTIVIVTGLVSMLVWMGSGENEGFLLGKGKGLL